jgi:predicted amino acid racemase
MGKFKFDGKYLKEGGRTIANVSGDRIRKGTGSSTVCNISGNKIRMGTGSSVLCNVSGDDIREGSGSSRIARMRDIRDQIDGPGGITLVALWYCFLR